MEAKQTDDGAQYQADINAAVSMYKKHSPKCYQPSFRSSETGTWKCPNCHFDLTLLQSKVAESRQTQIFLIKRKNPTRSLNTPFQVILYTFKKFD